MDKIILLPIPKKITWESGNFTFNEKTKYYSEATDCTYALRELRDFTGAEISCGNEASEIIFKHNSSFDEQEYELTVSENKITIVSYGSIGAFYAVKTLKTIYKQQKNIPCLHICDKPDIKIRATMFDFRYRIPTLETLKELVCLLSDMKYNQLQLYFESFAFYYSSFPQFYNGERVLMPEEIKELDEFCKERFVELVPCQASFGHMTNWLAHEELAHLGCNEKSSGSLNPLDPGSIELVEKIYDCILPCFSSDKVNICCDEVGELGFGKTAEAAEKYGKGKLFTDFLNKIHKLVSDKYGKKVMFWSDMVQRHPELWNDIPDDCTVLLWGYNAWYMRFDKFAPQIQKSGLDFYVCPGTSNWSSFTGRSANALYNIRKAAQAAEDCGASGILITDWGNSGNPQFEPISYFGYAVGASYGWNGTPSVIDYDETRSKLKLFDSWKHSYILHINHYNSIHYLDKLVFNCKNVCLGDTLYRMGNYLFLESEDVGDSTRCAEIYALGFGKEGYNMQKGYMKDINPVYYKNIVVYMQSIIEELNTAVPEDDKTALAISEMLCNCKMVKLMAETLAVQYYYYNEQIDEKILNDALKIADELKALKEEFVSLWNIRNHPAHSDFAVGRFSEIENALRNLEISKK